jgi:hypothetical protein
VSGARRSRWRLQGGRGHGAGDVRKGNWHWMGAVNSTAMRQAGPRRDPLGAEHLASGHGSARSAAGTLPGCQAERLTWFHGAAIHQRKVPAGGKGGTGGASLVPAAGRSAHVAETSGRVRHAAPVKPSIPATGPLPSLRAPATPMPPPPSAHSDLRLPSSDSSMFLRFWCSDESLEKAK